MHLSVVGEAFQSTDMIIGQEELLELHQMF